MKLDELLRTAKDSLTVRRVYGDPVEKDGLLLVPAAAVAGGFGGGEGKEADGGEGQGGGFGMSGRPAGAYVISGGQVIWRPAVDVNRVIAVLGLVAVAYLLTRPRMVRARARAAAS